MIEIVEWQNRVDTSRTKRDRIQEVLSTVRAKYKEAGAELARLEASFPDLLADIAMGEVPPEEGEVTQTRIVTLRAVVEEGDIVLPVLEERVRKANVQHRSDAKTLAATRQIQRNREIIDRAKAMKAAGGIRPEQAAKELGISTIELENLTRWR